MVDGASNGPVEEQGDVETPKKTKAQLKAERRSLQEAQRAAKTGKKAPVAQNQPKQAHSQDKNTEQKNVASKSEATSSADAITNDVGNLSVSSATRKTSKSAEQPAETEDDGIHPAFKSLAADCANGTLLDSHDICSSMADALVQFLSTFEAKSSGSLCRDVDAALRPQITYLTGGNALPAGCGTLVKLLKGKVHAHAEQRHLTDEQVRSSLLDLLASFKHERLSLCMDAMSQYGLSKLCGQRVLTYAWCPIVQRMLLDAHAHQQKLDASGRGGAFSVAVVDFEPDRPGRRLLSRLVEAGVPVTYSLLSSLAYTVRDTDIVLLGCDSVAANGHALVRLGSTQVALVARAHNVPVLLACPTYKFSEKVWTRATSDGTLQPTGATSGRGGRQPTAPSVDRLCTQRRELLPVDLVSALVTELRLLPPSSAPAVLRVKQQGAE